MIIVKGIKEANQLLKDFVGGTSDNTAASLITIATQLVEDMQQSSPVDTGFMRDHILYSNATKTSIQVDSTADYSGFVNFGTIHQEPQPFFTGPIEKMNVGTVFTKDAIASWNNAVNKNRY